MARVIDDEPILADREVFTGALVSVGYSRCAADHPAFAQRGRVSGHRFVFPKYGVWIQSRSIRYVSDPCVVEYYNDGDEFVRRPLDHRGDRTHWYQVAEPLVRDVVRSHDPAAADCAQAFRFAHGPSDTRAYALQRALFHRIVTAYPVEDLEVEETVLALLECVVSQALGTRQAPVRCITRDERDIAHRAREVLAQMTTARTGLARIARETGVSVFHLSRVFRKVTGRTLARHHVQLRLLASLTPLIESDARIEDIATAHGFAGHSHYSSAFRRVFGVAPSTCRRLPHAACLCPGALASERA
jgi:AraC-like DNA-binding protein